MARMNVRQMWAAKLAGRAVPAAVALPRNATPSAANSAAFRPRVAFVGLVLGIDPSLRGTGLALIEFASGRQPVLLRCHTVRVAAKHTMAVALGEIHRAVTDFLDGTAVRHVALEQTIFVQNIQTAQILGAGRGEATDGGGAGRNSSGGDGLSRWHGGAARGPGADDFRAEHSNG